MTAGRILLVEPEEEEARRLKAVLLRMRQVADVHTARRSVEGMARLAESRYAIVVASWTLPDQGGSDFLQNVAIRHPATRRVLSAERTPRLEEAFRTASLHGLLWKPWDDGDARALVERLLAGRT